MYNSIKNFNKQFDYEPEIQNSSKLKKAEKIIVSGMGGSALAAKLLKVFDPEREITIHSDYGLPLAKKAAIEDSLMIVSSYSGDTEEVLDVFSQSLKAGLNPVAVTTGGKLLEMAVNSGLPHVKMPETGIQPRMALGFSLLALAKISGREDLTAEFKKLSSRLEPLSYEKQGQQLAAWIQGSTPLIYSSNRNQPIAYNWKIKINETGKSPSFWNVFPELNHNEIAGFGAGSRKDITRDFACLILKDRDDSSEIKNRMDALEKIYNQTGVKTKIIKMDEENKTERVFASLLLADWTAYHLAKALGADPDKVAIIEEFKKRQNN